METLNNDLPTPSTKPNKIVPTLMLVLSLLGFLDATYLTIEHYRGVIPACNTVNGCEKVLTSSYSVVYGIPVALGGAVFYLAVLFLLLFYFDTKKFGALRLAARLTPLGFLASIYFFSLQAFILHSWCLYCLGSAVTSTLLFVIGMTVAFKKSSPTTI